jgi:two-component system, sensor histidine kinase and response regulator
MNKLLARQLKRHLSWANSDVVEAMLQAMEQAAAQISSEPTAALLKNMRHLLLVVDEAYTQFDRDVDLGSRSLQISSDELTKANDTLREEVISRQRAIDALWGTANHLQESLGRPALAKESAELEQLSILMGSLLDERQQAEAALLQQEAQFRALVDNIPGVVFRGEIRYPRGMHYINDEVEVLTGYPPKHFIGSQPLCSYGSLVHCDDLLVLEKAVDMAVAGADRYSIEYRILHAHGGIRWVLERGQVVRNSDQQPTYLDGIIFDISEQKQAAIQLRQLSAAIEANPIPVLITDVQGDIEYLNPKFEQTFGYSLAEIRGKTPRILASGETDPLFNQEMWQSLMRGEEWHRDVRNRCKSGDLIWMSVSISPIRDGLGKLTHFVAVYDNIELRKAAEKELIIAKEASDQANRLKSDFLANMSHEIRTPMNAIIGMTHLALKTDLSTQQRDYLNKTSSTAESLLHILNDILDFSKIEANRLQMEITPFRLESVLDKVSSVQALKAEEKGLHFSVFISPDCPCALMGDPLRMGQILNNLVGNAIKFTREGEVTVMIQRLSEQDNRVHLQISVRDTGIGLTPQQIDPLFKPFSQADTSTTRQFGGTGLGLSICKRLVELMDGEIWVDSVPSVGSVFNISLWFLRSAEDVLLEQTKMCVPRLDGVRILLVEDNELNQLVACELLGAVGASVTVAQHGGEALDWLSTNRPPPCDLILMDLQMPVVDGHKTTQLIRSNHQYDSIPIIAMTAHAMADERQRCLDSGMNDYITKPIQPDALFLTVAKWAGNSIKMMGELGGEHAAIEGGDEKKVPHFAGVNTKEVMERMRGNADLYIHLFQQFYLDYKNGYSEFQRLLNEDHKAAERWAHSLKGVAATLGMGDLTKAAEQLEQHLVHSPGDAGGAAYPLEQVLNDMLDALAQTDIPVSSPKPLRLIDREKLDPLLQRLFDLLHSFDGDSVEAYYNLREQLDGGVDIGLLDQLGVAINGFDFELAECCLVKIKAQL